MKRNWKLARTKVFEAITNDIEACRVHSKAMIFVDEPEIGKTVAGMRYAATTTNAFYVDCSQCKTRTLFIRALARTVGVTSRGTLQELKDAIKSKLCELRNPVVILDEAGDLAHEAFIDLKEYWNATEGQCGWYMMGADGLRTKIETGIKYGRPGSRELFSRYSGSFLSIVPTGRDDRRAFYTELLTDVLTHNVKDVSTIPGIVNRCLTRDAAGEIAGLRRAATIVALNEQ